MKPRETWEHVSYASQWVIFGLLLMTFLKKVVIRGQRDMATYVLEVKKLKFEVRSDPD